MFEVSLFFSKKKIFHWLLFLLSDSKCTYIYNVFCFEWTLFFRTFYSSKNSDKNMNFHKNIEQHNHFWALIIIINVSWVQNQHIRMISKGSCSIAIIEIHLIKKYIQIENRKYFSISLFCIQINSQYASNMHANKQLVSENISLKYSVTISGTCKILQYNFFFVIIY